MPKKVEGKQEQMRAYLSIEDIKGAGDMATVDVWVDQWNGYVQVKPLTLAQRKLVRKVSESKSRNIDGTTSIDVDAEEFELEAIVQGCVNPMFKRGDKDWLKRDRSSGAISTISRKILDLSGMGVQSEKKSDGGIEEG